MNESTVETRNSTEQLVVEQTRANKLPQSQFDSDTHHNHQGCMSTKWYDIYLLDMEFMTMSKVGQVASEG